MLSRLVYVLAMLLALAAGCQCSLDTSAIDDLRCSTDDDCDPRLKCEGGYCRAADCDPACAEGQSCTEAGCQCDDPALAACGPECVRTSSDPGHCGGCGNACEDEQVCQLGECASACDEGREECEGGCFDLQRDRDHCGGCETACEGDDVCVDGTCGTCTGPTDCDDGLACTIDDCADGVCTNEITPFACLAGGACLAPGEACGGGTFCTPCAGGCAVPPMEIEVSCDEARHAPGEQALCNVTVDEPTTAACLTCEALAGMTEIVRETFDDCDPEGNGWVVEGDTPICPLEQGAIFEGTDGDALEVDDGGWSIERRVDTTDFDTVRLCFDYAQDAADDNSTFTVSIQTSDEWDVVFDDLAPARAVATPTWLTQCVDLPEAGGNPDLGIRFALDSADNKDVYLDDIFLEGWVAADLAHVSLVSEDFTKCDYADWVVEGDDPRCPTEAPGWSDVEALEASEAAFLFSRTVGQAVCEDPWLLFGAGYSDPDGGERIVVEADLSGRWATIWGNLEGIGGDDEFTPVRVSLAHADPAARGNPAVMVRFGLTATGRDRAVGLDDIRIEGKSCGPAGERAAVSAPAHVTDTAYSFAVSSEQQLTLHAICRWADRDDLVGSDRVTFRR